MRHNAFYIVDEFLRSDNPQERKNALTALALMADDRQCLNKLVEVALADPDAGAYKRAVEEIESLPDRELDNAMTALEAELGEEFKGQRAYAALGYLKSKGKQRFSFFSGLDLPVSLWARLRLAWAMNAFLYPARTVAFRLRAWKPSLVGALIAVVTLLPFFLIQAKWARDDYLLVPIPVIVLAVLTGVFATQLTTPINLYYDRRVAFLVETLSAMILTLPVTVVLFVFGLLFTGTEEYVRLLRIVSWVMLWLVIVVGVARAATILSFGVTRHRRVNIFIQACVALAVVFLLLTALNFLIWRESPEVVAYYTVNRRPVLNYNYAVIQILWVCFLPVALAVASAFASIDKKSPPVSPVAGRAGIPFILLTIGLSMLLLAGVLVVGRRHHRAVAVNMNGLFDGLEKLWAERGAP